ncbi:MAG: hypothetical protein QOH58_3138 [Thermoleophilaceae bacterium]|jgi:hypothetical protein|nr:hypothetical protein [Thermoleophilaceae bacterium]
MAERTGQSAAAAAAEQVKAVLEAAERSAAEIVEAARADAERIRAEALEAVDRVTELAAGVREAVAALEREVDALREPDVPAAVEDPATRVDPEADDELIAEAEAVAARKPEPEPEPEPEEPPAAPAAAPEGARVLALKMALDGRPREETAGYLRENFELEDPEALLDEVYARAGR